MITNLAKIPFEYNGKIYKLSCNLNVINDVAQAFNGEVGKLLNANMSVNTLLVFIAAMLNDYADEMGWEERYTPKQVGRTLSKEGLEELSSMVMGAICGSPSESSECATAKE